MKSFIIVISLIVCLFECSHGEYVISGSELSEACDAAAQLLLRGKSETQVGKIITNQMISSTFRNGKSYSDGKSYSNSKSYSDGKPSLGYDGKYEPANNSQTGMMNLHGNQIWTIVASILGMTLRSGTSLAGVCPSIQFPDQLDLTNNIQVETFINQLKLHKEMIKSGY